MIHYLTLQMATGLCMAAAHARNDALPGCTYSVSMLRLIQQNCANHGLKKPLDLVRLPRSVLR